MEDIWKFFLIATVVIIGIIREANKNKSPKKAETNGIPDLLEPEEPQTATGSIWEDLFDSKPAQPVLQTEPKKPWVNPLLKEKKEVLQNPSKKETPVKTKQPDQSEHLSTNVTSEKEKYAIQSVEEARRAIILGEILQRKY